MKISNTYINGEIDNKDTGINFQLINPSNEEDVGSLICSSEEQINKAVISAKNAQENSENLSIKERIYILEQIIDGIELNKEELANAMTLEMGAPIKLTTSAHIQMGLDHLINTINVLKNYKFSESSDGFEIIRSPIGVVALITPWNWPLNQTLTKIASSIAAGCSIIIKPSEYSSLSAKILIDIIDKTDLPKGIFNMVNGIGKDIGPFITSHPDINMISFTGSTEAGINIQELAAKSVKRVSLELGGKSAHIICQNVDLNTAIPNAIDQCFINSGQSCSAPTRLLVHENDITEINEIIINHVKNITTGDPMVNETDLGPVVNKKQFNSIQQYIESGIKDKFDLVTGGLGRCNDSLKGFYIKPTIFTNVSNQSKIAQEEIFGPVLCIISYKDINDAISIANDSKYGLSSYITSNDNDEAMEIAKKLRAGQTIINKKSRGSVPAPFGGFKMSGNGREHGQHGLEEYLEIKAII